ncbi:FtsX-like permease family protein [Streptomyces sp. NPDC005970]|uniref:FtsX-like permease family protein n=1 Tax=Streptomyces sp. NPDC005970 TaxID=3156723 RepID=UPI0034032592
MSALGRVVRSGVRRRRVQNAVIGLATTMAVTAAVLCASLLVASSAPFADAFAKQRGAHLSVRYDAAKATAAQLAGSADARGVTATAGPFPTASVTPSLDGEKLVPMSVVGRADPGRDPVDRVTLTEGVWATRPGQIVLSPGAGAPPVLGLKLSFPDLPGDPTLTVVGVARSVSRTADAWVAPSQIASLTAPGARAGYQMLYRFADADTGARIAAGRAAVKAAVPAGARVGDQSWLSVKREAEQETAVFVPFLVAFGVLGLVMAVLIVGNVVAGAVGGGLRRIGVLKALGFTPAQVVRAYMAQALIPAAFGTVVGVVAGTLLTRPVLSEAEEAYGTAGLIIAPWVVAAVAAGALGLVAAVAWASAARAGRLRAVDALAVGRSARPGRGRAVVRLTGRLPLSRPLGLGLARPFARPARAAAMVAAVAFGATAVTFAVGLAASLNRVQDAREHDRADVTVDPKAAALGPDGGPDGGPGPHRRGPGGPPRITADPAAITAAIKAQPGTRAYYATAATQVTIAGLTGSTELHTFAGDATWANYRKVSGRWFEEPGEAVVPSQFLAATGTRLGDTVALNHAGKTVRVRIVGEVFDPRNQGMNVLTDAATLAPASPPADSYRIALKPGTDAAAYVTALNSALGSLDVTARSGPSGGESEVILVLDALAALLTLMLVAVAGLGVLNAVVLDTRERVHDLGVHKALGMTPRQTVAMVLASVVVVGVAGGALGVPAGLALHAAIVPAMGESAGLTLPTAAIDVYTPPELLLLGLGGLLIAVTGALLPAGWAARTRTATALRTE